jgi:hypothetical protein
MGVDYIVGCMIRRGSGGSMRTGAIADTPLVVGF